MAECTRERAEEDAAAKTEEVRNNIYRHINIVKKNIVIWLSLGVGYLYVLLYAYNIGYFYAFHIPSDYYILDIKKCVPIALWMCMIFTYVEWYWISVKKDEIVNQILSEREEAIRIAQAYKEELDKVEISDEDIKHLHSTVTSVLSIMRKVSSGDEKRNSESEVLENNKIESYEQLKDLISVDTLKTMQLLGFNYKVAIGEPLTKLCSEAISKWGNKNNKKNR